MPDPPMARRSPPARRQRPPQRRFWFVVHGWLGMTFSLLMAVIVLSGVAATLAYEIEWLADPDLRVAPGRKMAPYPELVGAVARAHPESAVEAIYAPEAPYLPVLAYISTPDTLLRKVYVDPHRATVLADKDFMTIQRFLRNLHMKLFLPRHGILLVGVFGLILLSSTVTGILAYKKFWRGFFRLRVAKGRRVFWGDLHRLSGLWSLWFLVVISLTGIWYGIEDIIDRSGSELVYPSYPRVSAARLDSLGPETPARVPLADAIATAKREVPGLEITAIRLSTSPSDPIVVHGGSGHTLVRGRANAVFVDPYDGSAIEVWRISEASLAKRWVHTVDPLHFGTFGGLATKIIWALFGLLIAAQIFTGSWMWLRRAHQEGRRGAVLDVRRHRGGEAESGPISPG